MFTHSAFEKQVCIKFQQTFLKYIKILLNILSSLSGWFLHYIYIYMCNIFCLSYFRFSVKSDLLSLYYAIQICVPNSCYLCALSQLRQCRDMEQLFIKKIVNGIELLLTFLINCPSSYFQVLKLYFYVYFHIYLSYFLIHIFSENNYFL